MAVVADSVLEEIKARTDLADLISSYGIDVKHAGASLKACCPFHSEKTPSFNINQSKGFYHCFGCGESGDAITFVMKYEGLDFMSAVGKLAERCGVKIESREDPDAGRRRRLLALMAELAQFYHRCLGKMSEASPAREYLAKRALDGQVQEDFLICYAPNGVRPMLTWAEKYGYTLDEMEAAGVVKGPSRPGDLGYHRFSGRLMFPVRDRQGRVVAFSGRQLVERKNSGKYVNSPETLIFKKSKVLFGFDRAAANIAKAPHREAIVCEGQIDAIRLHVSGFPVAVASQGTAFTEDHARMLKRVADAVLLVFDDDAAGHKATVKTAALLLAAEMPVRVVSLPGGDDPDSFLRTKGADAFRRLMDSAESIASFQCRIEQANERDPKSIDAVSRISKAVLATIACCPSAVLRASMVGETAKILGLPASALAEELEKVRSGVKPVAPPAEVPREPVAHEEVVSHDASEAEPPPAREMALMAFLVTAERSEALDRMVRDFMPDGLFANGFTRGFVEAWRVGGGDDPLAAFADSLDALKRGWFDRILLAAGRTDAGGRSPTDIMQEFVRGLWHDRLVRMRGALPASGDPEADMARLKISYVLKRINLASWHDVKEMIRQLKTTTKGEDGNGP